MATPIKRYNYERSAYRWLLARHPKQFEARGVTSTVLERAPAARKAFYCSGWPGAQLLIRCVEGRFERTIFFDNIINRGLLLSTRFAFPHLTTSEAQALQICQSGTKFYLSYFMEMDDAEFLSELHGGMPNCKVRNDIQRQLWRTISGHIGPEIESIAPNRSITVTKAVKATTTRTITQIVIEIDSGDMPDAADAAIDSFTAAMGVPASIPLSPEHSSRKRSAAEEDAPPLPAPACDTGVPMAAAPLPSHADGLSGLTTVLSLHPSQAKRARVAGGGGGGLSLEGLTPGGLTSFAPMDDFVFETPDMRCLDDVDVDILSGLF